MKSFVFVGLLLCTSAQQRAGDVFDSLFNKKIGKVSASSAEVKNFKAKTHAERFGANANPEDMTHDMLAEMFKEQEQRKTKYKKAGGNLKNYFNMAPKTMDSIIQNIELTLEEQKTNRAEMKEQVEMDNKEAVGVKDRSAEAVDQVLVHEAEESLADKEASDPLLSDPLLSLEEDHEEDENSADLDKSIDQLKGEVSKIAARRRFDPDLFKEDTIKSMDTDGDGLLSKKELMVHLEKMVDRVRQDELKVQKEVNAAGIAEVMGMLDDNKDGFIDKDELFGKTTQTAAQKRSDERMFNFADHNHDGKLDSDEVFMMALPQYWPNKQQWYDFKAGDHMDTMDTNQDGFVDWKEYNNEMKQVIDGWDTGIGENVKAHFDFADKDHNAKLDQKEMSAMIGNMDKGYMQSVVSEMMKIGDTKTVDGKLSLNEIIAHAKDFGSDIQIFMENPALLFVKGVGDQHNDKFVSKALKGQVPAAFGNYGPKRKDSLYPQKLLNAAPLDALEHRSQSKDGMNTLFGDNR